MLFSKEDIESVIVFQTKITINIENESSVYSCDIYFDFNKSSFNEDKLSCLDKLISLYDLEFYDFFGNSRVYKVSTN